MVEQADPEEHESWSYQLSFAENAVVSLFKFVNKYIPWHKLPSIIGTFVGSSLVRDIPQLKT